MKRVLCYMKVLAKQVSNLLGTLLHSLVTGNGASWDCPVAYREFPKNAPSSVRLSTFSAAILKAHVSKVHGSSRPVADEDLYALLAQETKLDIFPLQRGTR